MSRRQGRSASKDHHRRPHVVRYQRWTQWLIVMLDWADKKEVDNARLLTVVLELRGVP
jgi:hypothetical protein